MNVYPRNISEGFYFRLKETKEICEIVTIRDDKVVIYTEDSLCCTVGLEELEHLPYDDVSMGMMKGHSIDWIEAENGNDIVNHIIILGEYKINMQWEDSINAHAIDIYSLNEDGETHIFYCHKSIDYITEIQNIIRLNFLPQLEMKLPKNGVDLFPETILN